MPNKTNKLNEEVRTQISDAYYDAMDSSGNVEALHARKICEGIVEQQIKQAEIRVAEKAIKNETRHTQNLELTYLKAIKAVGGQELADKIINQIINNK